MKLQPLLTEYLYANGSLPLQQAGQLELQQTPARFDTDSATLLAPESTIIFQPNDNQNVDRKLVDFISSHLQMSTAAAQGLLNHSKLANAIADAGGNFTWPAVGKFLITADGTLSFQPENFRQRYLPDILLSPVQKTTEPEANSVLHQPEVEISEPEHAAADLEGLQYNTGTKNRWWIGVIIIFILSLLLIAYRYL